MTELTTNEGESVLVEPADGRIGVVWGCGGQYNFAPADLTDTIAYVELVSDFGADVWLTHRDSDGKQFSARVAGGRFYADGDPSDEAHYVGWSAFKTALQEASFSKAVTRPKSGRFRRLLHRLQRKT